MKLYHFEASGVGNMIQYAYHRRKTHIFTNVLDTHADTHTYTIYARIHEHSEGRINRSVCYIKRSVMIYGQKKEEKREYGQI
jgi:hypothetical protein